MKPLLAAILVASSLPAAAQITLFGREGLDGRSITVQGADADLARRGFSDRASSAIVRGGRYEVCEHANFGGRCMVLRPGQYPSLATMGMGDAISSVRAVGRQARVEEQRFAPPPPVAYDYRRRGNERIYEAEVVSARAIYGGPQQRCWVDREAVASDDRNVGGAIAGAIIGGILGHQVGSGRGNDAATAGGAVIGGLLGSQGGTTYGRDVERCREVRGRPEFWDVTYRFRGVNRTVQLARAPGPTIKVNAQGEPRA